MRTMEVILNFLLNGAWQIAAIALVAGLGNHLLQSVTKYRHVIWAAALAMSLLLPLMTSIPPRRKVSVVTNNSGVAIKTAATVPLTLADTGESIYIAPSSGFHISRKIAFTLLAIYLLLIGYRSARLVGAAIKTRATRKRAVEFDPEGNLRDIV